MSDAVNRAKKAMEEAAARRKQNEKDIKVRVQKTPGLGETVRTAQEFNDNVSWLRRQFANATEFGMKSAKVAKIIWDHSLGPVLPFVAPTAKWGAKKYGQFWNWAAYKKDKETGFKTYSHKRAASAVAATALGAAAVFYGTVPAAKLAGDLTWDAVVLASQREAELYTFGSETIEEDFLYSVKTSHELPSTPDSALILHVRRNILAGIFYPENVAGAVPEVVSKGTVTYGGWRIKPLGLYPEMIDIEVTPIAESDLQETPKEETPPSTPSATPPAFTH